VLLCAIKHRKISVQLRSDKRQAVIESAHACAGRVLGERRGEDSESDPDDMGGQKILEVKTVAEVIYQTGLCPHIIIQFDGLLASSKT
jgi:hypothetical protein